MWQDWLITSVQWIFTISLLLIIRDKDKKPPFLPSIITSVGVYLISFAFATLGLWLSFLSALIMATEWAIIAYQRYRLDRKERRY
ncbi:hypothetical protein HY417_00540 [Candidatus Kaiserbacteria bacterium]|nr:hypothetical protein [Candidatus Kaiserbacteria bacterium]